MKHRPSALIGIIITLAFIIIAILDVVHPQYLGVSNAGSIKSFSNIVVDYRKEPQPPVFNQGWEYYFGTTFYGLPIFPVILASFATDIEYSFLVVAVSSVIGVIIGVFSAFVGRRSDLLVMRGTDIFLSFPAIVVVMLYDSSQGWNYLNISLGLIIIWWTTYARLARGATLPLRSYNFVEAGIASGCTKVRAIFTHIIPNIMPSILVQMTLDVGMVISIFATVNFLFSPLSYADAFVPELGNMMVGFPKAGVIIAPFYWGSGPPSASILLAAGSWWPIVMPGIFLVLFIVSINLAGDGLRDYLNPLTRNGL